MCPPTVKWAEEARRKEAKEKEKAVGEGKSPKGAAGRGQGHEGGGGKGGTEAEREIFSSQAQGAIRRPAHSNGQAAASGRRLSERVCV